MTFSAIMYPDTQIFRHISPTFRAKLATIFGINFSMVSPSFKGNPIQDAQELTRRTIQDVLAKHSSTQTQDIQVFCKYHSCLTTKMMTGNASENLFVDSRFFHAVKHVSNTQICILWRGTYSPPNPPTVKQRLLLRFEKLAHFLPSQLVL